MRAPRILALLCLTAAPVLAQQPDPRATVTVGTASARRGQTATGWLRIPAGADAATDIPVAVVNGTKAGPLVAVVAGSHGTEYTSIIALTRLISQLDPKALSGTVIVAPLLNVASFNQMTVHTNPVDTKGMNAQYPGDAAGTQTQRALAAVTDQIVKPADVIIDLHGGDLDEDLRPYSYWIRTGKAAQDSASRALALAFGLNMIIVRDIDTSNPASTRSLSSYALSLGKTALVAEAGRSGLVLTDDLNALTEGTLNALGSLRMLERTAKPVERPVWVDAGASGGGFRRDVLRHRGSRRGGGGGNESRLHDGLSGEGHRRDPFAALGRRHVHPRRAVGLARRDARRGEPGAGRGAGVEEALTLRVKRLRQESQESSCRSRF